jgi:hypothetical protein
VQVLFAAPVHPQEGGASKAAAARQLLADYQAALLELEAAGTASRRR